MSARNLSSLILAESDNSGRKRAVQVLHVFILLTKVIPIEIVEWIMSFNIVRVDVVVNVELMVFPTPFNLRKQKCVRNVLDWVEEEIDVLDESHNDIQAVEIYDDHNNQRSVVDYHTGESYNCYDVVNDYLPIHLTYEEC